MKPLSQSIEPLTRPLFNKRGFAQGRILTHWPQIIGTDLAGFSLPQKITFPAGKKTDGTLHLQVESGRALEITYMEPQILERINTYFGYRAVGSITMQQAPLPSTQAVQAPIPNKPTKQTRAALTKLLATVDDDELKAALMSLGEAMTVKNSSLEKVTEETV